MMGSLQMHAINVKAERRVPSDTFCSSLRNRLRFPCPCVGFATKPLWADHHKGIEDSSMLMCRICLPARHRVSRKLFHCQQAVACLQKKKRIPVQKAGSFWSPESGQSSLRVCPRGTDLEPVFWAQKWDLSFGSLIPKFWTRLVRFFEFYHSKLPSPELWPPAGESPPQIEPGAIRIEQPIGAATVWHAEVYSRIGLVQERPAHPHVVRVAPTLPWHQIRLVRWPCGRFVVQSIRARHAVS